MDLIDPSLTIEKRHLSNGLFSYINSSDLIEGWTSRTACMFNLLLFKENSHHLTIL
jgi:hypothetical protein